MANVATLRLHIAIIIEITRALRAHTPHAAACPPAGRHNNAKMKMNIIIMKILEDQDESYN